MRFAARLSAGLGKADVSFVQAQDQVLDALGFSPIHLSSTVDEVLSLMKRDKKVCNGVLRFVLPQNCGAWEVFELPDATVQEYVRAWLTSGA